MPFIDICDSELTPEFYTLVHAVGKNCPNHMTTSKPSRSCSKCSRWAPASLCPKANDSRRNLRSHHQELDSKIQLDMRANAVMLTADQRIDRVRNNQSIGVISHNEVVGWSNIPSMVTMADAATVLPPGNNYVPENVGSQQTSPQIS